MAAFTADEAGERKESSATQKNAVFFIVDANFFPFARALAERIRILSRGALPVEIFYESPTPPIRELRSGINVRHNLLMPQMPDSLPVFGRWSKIVWARLFAPKILSAMGYDRALYLDADIAVASDLRAVFDAVPGQAPLACVADMATVGLDFPGTGMTVAQRRRRIGLHGNRYFNSGAIMVHVGAWSEIDFAGAVITYCNRYLENLSLPDQDFLNHYFEDQWVELSPRWNFQITLLAMGLETYLDPAIVHYCASVKPWHRRRFLYDPVHTDYFARILSESGFDGARLCADPEGARRGLVRRLKAWYREQLYVRGYTTSRVANKARNWTQERAEKFAYLRRRLRQGRFCDITAHEAARLLEALEELEQKPARFKQGYFYSVPEDWPHLERLAV